ncbi:hypothetical protein QBC34DRAFT_383813 [Podospora aff. communis PSN243]|uniref:Uncharacterized protein n=1 Tax=Podospora aff. communis PSN243 TaxID=3040156 RepID=A0AAV9GF91_9PEZI|nr:hypothetical protein QBC34DRAFT_383813 [Podospora aff. communis PSN243]
MSTGSTATDLANIVFAELIYDKHEETFEWMTPRDKDMRESVIAEMAKSSVSTLATSDTESYKTSTPIMEKFVTALDNYQSAAEAIIKDDLPPEEMQNQATYIKNLATLIVVMKNKGCSADKVTLNDMELVTTKEWMEVAHNPKGYVSGDAYLIGVLQESLKDLKLMSIDFRDKMERSFLELWDKLAVQHKKRKRTELYESYNKKSKIADDQLLKFLDKIKVQLKENRQEEDRKVQLEKKLLETQRSKCQLEKKLLGVETSLSLQEGIIKNLASNTWVVDDAQGTRNLHENARILAEARIVYATEQSRCEETANYLPFELHSNPGDSQVVKYTYKGVDYEDQWYLRGETIYFRNSHGTFKGCERRLSKVQRSWYRRLGIRPLRYRCGLDINWNGREKGSHPPLVFIV